MKGQPVIVLRSQEPEGHAADAAGTVLLVSGDAPLRHQLSARLLAARESYQLPVAANLDQARRQLRLLRENRSAGPLRAILLDAEALHAASLPAVLAEFAAQAPVILIAPRGDWARILAPAAGAMPPQGPAGSPAIEAGISLMVEAGCLEILPRDGGALAIVPALVDRHALRESPGPRPPHTAGGGLPASAAQSEGEFGEMLRHELNNPLTGILGNAELLLARREQLPPPMVARLETITELAIRLRETIRRLGDMWNASGEAGARLRSG